MTPIAEILSRSGSNWRAYSPPLPEELIAGAQRRIGLPLPEALLELYRVCNSGDGSLPYSPWNFVLWGINEVAELREHEHYRKYYDDLIFFGSDGGGDYFGLDPAGRVFVMDPIAGEESIVVVAQSFDEFVANVGISDSGTPSERIR